MTLVQDEHKVRRQGNWNVLAVGMLILDVKGSFLVPLGCFDARRLKRSAFNEPFAVLTRSNHEISVESSTKNLPS